MVAASSGADVVLVRPQEHDYDYLQWHEDIALGHVLREVRGQGLIATVHDFALRPLLSAAEYDEAVNEVASSGAKIVFLVIDKHPTNSPHYAGRFIRALREHPALENTHLSVYGNTQVGTRRLLDEFPVDSVVVGEEVEAGLLAAAVVRGGDLCDVPGIAARTEDGHLTTPPLPNHGAFAVSSPPARYFFDLPAASRNTFGYVAAIEASRGCYAKCTFCYIRTKDRVYGDYAWVGREPSDVVAEMACLYADFGAREFAFVDPQFFAPGKKGQRWALQLADEILASGMHDIAFSIYARANDMRRETLERLKAAGLYAVFIGIESFSQTVLDRYRKGMTVARNIAAIELLMDLDLRLRMGFVSFDHDTTFEELEESIGHLQRLLLLKPHLITQPVFFQNILAPLDDTPIGDSYQLRGVSAMPVEQPADRLLLARRQARLTRGGPITTFADDRIAAVSDLVRVLAAEITQRSTRLERACSEYLHGEHDFVDIDGRQLAPERVLSWFNDLTRFAILEFANIVSKVKEHGAGDGIEATIIDAVTESARQFDMLHLGIPIALAESSALTLVD